MMKGLIGYTGFVGSNLAKQIIFDEKYNSINIEEIKNKEFDFLICAGTPGEKWRANANPNEDKNSIEKLIQNLRSVKSKIFILISTVDVYHDIKNVNEDTEINPVLLKPYGLHRYQLEKFIKNNFHQPIIIRLPGLFGQGIKKNIIYDFLYNNNLNNVDSLNIFQFYNLERLSRDIKICMDNNLDLINFSTEPVSVKEIAKSAFSIDFNQSTSTEPICYDIKSIFSDIFDQSSNGYISSKKIILKDLKKFINEQRKKIFKNEVFNL